MGIAATFAANVAHGLSHSPVGAAVAAWPAVALVGSYELLMLIIRRAQPSAVEVPAQTVTVPAELPYALRARAFEEFAEDVNGGRMPSVRTIHARLCEGQPGAQLVRAYLAALPADPRAVT